MVIFLVQYRSAWSHRSHSLVSAVISVIYASLDTAFFDLRCLETGIFLRFVIKLVLSFHGYAAFLLEKTGLMKLYSFFRFYHYLFWRGCSTFGNTTQCQTGSFVCLSYVAMPPTNSKCLIYNHFSHSNLVAFPRSSCALS